MASQQQETTKNKSQQKKKKRSFLKYIILFWMFFLLTIGALTLFIYGTSNGLLGPMPSIEEIANPQFIVASEVISSDNKILGKYFKENRKTLRYKDLPENLVKALISTEDERYLEHSGIDIKALFRAVGKLGKDGGGSTITQQTAKLLFTGQRASNKLERIQQKIKEMVIAVELEKTFTKEEIVAIYFNKFDFVYNAKGIEAAAKTYFNKSAKNLSLGECATFVAMLRNPWKYNPKRNYDKAKLTRDVVLNQMLRNKAISKEVCEAEKKKPIVLDFHRNFGNSGLSAYYKESLKKEVYQKLKGLKKPDDSAYNVYKDGLKIYVTLDSDLQAKAERAVKKHLKRYQKVFDRTQKYNKRAPFYKISQKKIDRIFESAKKRTQRYRTLKENGMSDDSINIVFNTPIPLEVFTWDGAKEMMMSPMDSIRYHKSILQTGVMSMENKTGFIKAWVGGNDFNHFKYDMVKQGARQVGSTFKPIVYATLINQLGTSPCESFSGAKYSQGGWNPRNSGGGYPSSIILYKALAISMNTVTARIINRVGVENVIQMARNMGITGKIPNNQTIALGTAGLSVHDMVGAYGTFANHGIYTKPVMVLRIEDRQGKVIYDYTPDTHIVFSDEVATVMIKMMKGVSSTTLRGTAKRLRRGPYNFGSTEIACKTGTTNDNSDGWFIGVTPKLTTGIWVGCEDRFAHFQSTGYGQGAAIALPIWGYYMKDVYRTSKDYKRSDKFDLMDKDDMQIAVDCKSYSKTIIGSEEWLKSKIKKSSTGSISSIDVDINDTIREEYNRDLDLDSIRKAKQEIKEKSQNIDLDSTDLEDIDLDNIEL